MKYFFIVFTFFVQVIACHSVFCQENNDSLLQVVKNEKNVNSQIDMLIDLSINTINTNFEEALSYAQFALFKLKELPHHDENKSKEALLKNIRGICYLNLGQYDKSINSFLQSLTLAEEIQDSARMSKALNNLGMIYGFKRDHEKSINYFKESSKIAEFTGDIISLSISYSNIAASCFDVGNYDEGQIYYDKAMDIFKEIGDDEGIAALYVMNGNRLSKQNKFKKALKFYDLAESIYLETGNIESQMSLYDYKAQLYEKVNKKDKALFYYNKLLEVAKELNATHSLLIAYNGIALIYKEKGEYKKALDNFIIYEAWKDSVYDLNKENAIAEMQAKYDFEKEERENKLLKQEASIAQLEIENKEKQLENSKVIMFSVGAVGGLLLLLAFTLYKQNKLKEETNLKLKAVNQEIVLANQIIEEKNKDILSSIEYAKYIQQAILPKKESFLECFSDTLLFLKPKDVVSGDFYWFNKYGKYAVLVMADCTGHGVPGGFMSMMGAEMLNQVLIDPEVVDAAKALEEINLRIKNNLNKSGSERQQNDGMDVSICIFNTEELTVQFAGANRPLVCVKNGELSMIKPDRFGVGGELEIEKHFTNHTLNFQKGDRFYMYSDGYPDQFGGPKYKKFMRKRFLKLLLNISNKPMAEQEKELLAQFLNWKGELEQIDDVCIVGVQI
jgi:serine phosphatase RsbU (regulator of sigma subunit)/tetratricopeptide (TPR) repeat protein